MKENQTGITPPRICRSRLKNSATGIFLITMVWFGMAFSYSSSRSVATSNAKLDQCLITNPTECVSEKMVSWKDWLKASRNRKELR